MIRYIFHISDLHIHHKTYENIKHSFKKLVEEIIEKGVDSSLLVIAGDIFEYKSYLAPDDIFVFQTLCALIDEKQIRTIICIGNHDQCSVANYATDNVSILLKRNQYSTIICRPKSCIISGSEVGDDRLEFYIFSPLDGETNFNIDKSKTKIAILHEPINNAKYENNERITNARFNVNDLKCFDYVLLGDIHKTQFLTDRMAYCGSFVQKNRGESIEKGYILWDLDNGTGTFIAIPLRYLALKIECSENKMPNLPVLEENQRVVYISLIFRNCTDIFITVIKDKVSKYGYINKIIIDNKKSDIDKIEHELRNNNDFSPEVYRKLITKSFEHSSIIKEILLEKVKDEQILNSIIEHHSKKLQDRNEFNYTTYRLNYLVWDNIFCYGEGNYINFREFNQNLVMLNGNNKEGKSSVIDIIIRILFNECERGYKEDIVNKSKSKGHIKISFNIGEDEYVIEQVYHRISGNQSHRLYKNGKNITQDSINNTYKYLKNKIGLGSYNDFVNMTTALQNRKYLVDLPNKDFVQLLTKITNIDVLKDLEDENKSEINALKALNKKFNLDIEKIPKVDKSEVDGLFAEMNSLYANKDEIQNNIKKINSAIINANQQIIRISISNKLENIIEEQKLQLKTMDKRIINKYINDSLGFINEDGVYSTENLTAIRNYINDLYKQHKKNISNVGDNIKSIILRNNYDHLRTISRADLIKQIKCLRDSCQKPKELSISENDAHDIISKGLPHNSIKPIEKCEIDSIVDLTPYANEEFTSVSDAKAKADEYKLKIDLNITRVEKIDKPDYYHNLDEYLSIVKKGLPNYDELEIEQQELTQQVSNINSTLSSMKFNPACGSCKINTKLCVALKPTYKLQKIKKIDHVLSAKQKHYNNINIIRQRIEVIEKYTQYEKYVTNEEYKIKLEQLNEVIKNMEKYEYYKKQNEIFKNNLESQKYNDNLSSIIKKYYNAVDAIKEYENLSKWNELQKLEKTLNEFKERDMQMSFNEIYEIEKVLRLIDLQISLGKNIELLETKKKNSQIEDDIKKLNLMLSNFNDRLNETDEKKNRITEEYYTKRSHYNEREKYTSSYQENINSIQFLDLYHMCINYKTGIPSFVINHACKIIQHKCNDFLQRITDFTIEIVYDKDIRIYTIDGSVRIPATMGSGMQKFVLDMIMRITLTQISNISNPNLIFIDEGFGTLDKENFIAVAEMMQKLKQNFDALCFISHISELKTYADVIIDIKRINGCSLLQFGNLTPDEKSIKLNEDKAHELIKLNNFKDVNSMFRVEGENVTCLGCKKTFKNTKGAITRHSNASTYKSKHEKFFKL